MKKKANGKKTISIGDVRNAMGLVKDYLENNQLASTWEVTRLMIDVLGDDSIIIQRLRKDNYCDEVIGRAKESGWFPIFINENYVLEYIRWKDITNFSIYKRGDIRYFMIKYNGKEIEMPFGRKDAVCLRTLMGLDTSSGDDYSCLDNHYYKNSQTNPGEKSWFKN